MESKQVEPVELDDMDRVRRASPRVRREAPEHVVNYIRERYNLDGVGPQAISRELGGTMPRCTVYMIAVGLRRRSVPLSDRLRKLVEEHEGGSGTTPRG